MLTEKSKYTRYKAKPYDNWNCSNISKLLCEEAPQKGSKYVACSINDYHVRQKVIVVKDGKVYYFKIVEQVYRIDVVDDY
jgi:hypothetical protein